MIAPFELRKIVKDYNGLKALDHVSLTMKPGEILGLLGPNGAGKTSLISILTTMERSTSGDVQIFGHPVGGRREKLKIGVVPQEIVGHGFFTVEEVLRFHSGLYGVTRNESHIQFLLQRLTLTAHRNKRVAQLSGGMKRRLLIAKALVHQPQLLLLDEPTAGVDIELRTSLWKFVRELNEEFGVSILLTTHYLEEAEELCHRIGILDKGRLLRLDDTKTLVNSLSARTVEIITAKPLPPIKHEMLVRQEAERLVFSTSHSVTLKRILSEAQIPLGDVVDVHIHEGTLEDAFLKMVVNV